MKILDQFMNRMDKDEPCLLKKWFVKILHVHSSAFLLLLLQVLTFVFLHYRPYVHSLFVLFPRRMNLELVDPQKTYYFRGHEFKQLFQLIPSLAPYYFEWESDLVLDDFLSNPIHKYWWLPIVAVVVYLLFCYFGPKMVSKGVEVRGPLILWNLFLSTFSLIGAIRTVPHLLYNVTNKSLEETICVAPEFDWGAGATGLWVGLFIFSKLPELIDTVFIVIRKKPLIFLHWYHHVTVLLYCWHAYYTEAGSGLYFIAMNYSVHAVMYGYYALSAMKVLPKWFPAHIITFFQISQMFVGTFICGASWYYVTQTDRPCHNDLSNLIAGAVMYGSYLYLFVEFAIKRFVLKDKSGKKKPE